MAEHPTTSWQAMQDGNVFYRQQRLYTLDGKLPSLGDCIVAGCRNGGPLGALALACHHKEVHCRLNSPHEGYEKNDCYWTCNTYILKITNSGVLTFRRGLTAAQRTCRLPDPCTHFLCSRLVGTSQNYPLWVDRRRETSDPKRGGRIPSLRPTRRLHPILFRY